jgi:hypothetical protein
MRHAVDQIKFLGAQENSSEEKGALSAPEYNLTMGFIIDIACVVLFSYPSEAWNSKIPKPRS